MHCELMYITDAFQMRFDRISNAIDNKGDLISTCFNKIENKNKIYINQYKYYFHLKNMTSQCNKMLVRNI